MTEYIPYVFLQAGQGELGANLCSWMTYSDFGPVVDNTASKQLVGGPLSRQSHLGKAAKSSGQKEFQGDGVHPQTLPSHRLIAAGKGDCGSRPISC